ncbi:MAG: SPASM domain-containing protein [Phycisphaerae bacterium]
MRVIAVVQADLEVTPLGTRSRLADDLMGVPVLRRTLLRLARASRVSTVYVLCPGEQHARCVSLLRGVDAVVRAHDAPPPPWRPLVQTARKWSLDAWRGGVGGTTHFDEFTDARPVDALLAEAKADAVLMVPPSAPLLDPDLVDALIDHLEAHRDDSKLSFMPAPPGLTGIALSAAMIRELAEKNIPLGWIFSYKPDDPQRDLVFQSCRCEAPAVLSEVSVLLMADTRRSFDRIDALLQSHPDPCAETIGRWFADRDLDDAEPMPREVEIELMTSDPYPESRLRPRGGLVELRGPIDPALVERIAAEVSSYDDALVVLGGFGDPLCHPRFSDVLAATRRAQDGNRRLFGLAVRTCGVNLSDNHIRAVIDHDVDLLCVLLDAWTPALYARLQSPARPDEARLADVLQRIESLTAAVAKRHAVKPLVVPEMVKTTENVHELDAFHDGWLRRVGAVNIVGPSHYGHLIEDRGVLPMAPFPRTACRRIRSRCVVLADGRVTLCDQDVNGRHAVGDLNQQSLEEIWMSTAYENVRDAHRRDCFDVTPLCGGCEEWHRP